VQLRADNSAYTVSISSHSMHQTAPSAEGDHVPSLPGTPGRNADRVTISRQARDLANRKQLPADEVLPSSTTPLRQAQPAPPFPVSPKPAPETTPRLNIRA